MVRILSAVFLLALPLTPTEAQPVQRDQVEFGGVSYGYSAGISPWRGATVRTQFVRGPRHTWIGEAVAEHRFGEPSFAYKIQHGADFGTWLTRLAFRTSNGGFYNPRFRVDAAVGKKILPGRKLILMMGGTYRDGRDGHKDASVIVESQWYLTPWLIAQGSVRFQQSNPGNAQSRYQDVALTLGRHGKATVVLHAAGGTEAYQIIEPLVIYTNFRSQLAQVAYRQWVTRDAGISVSASHYSNPYYQRVGVELSFFFGFNSGGR
jgi:YaiO family outer membrane protein